MLSPATSVKLAKLYTSGALVIGAIEVIDGCMHALNIWADWRLTFSLFETCWFAVSLLILFVFIQTKLPRQLPIAFILYMLASFIYATVLLTGADAADEQTVLPEWYGWAAALFGFVYALLAYNTYTRYLLRSKVDE